MATEYHTWPENSEPHPVGDHHKDEVKEAAKRDYKDEYKKFQSSDKSKKYRAELNKYNRDKGTYGNGDGKDASHKGGKIVGFEKESVNRGRAEKSRLKKEYYLSEDEKTCWKGYEQIGMKEKDGRQVPNCVPIKEEKLTEDGTIKFSKEDMEILHKNGKLEKNGHTYIFSEGKLKEFTSKTDTLRKKIEVVMGTLTKRLGIKSTVKNLSGKGGMSFFLDDPKEAKKLKKELEKRMKDVKVIDLDKEGGDESNHVVYARLFEGKLTEGSKYEILVVYKNKSRTNKIKSFTDKKKAQKFADANDGELAKIINGRLKTFPKTRVEGNLTEAKESIFDVAARVMKDQQNYNYKSKKGMVKLDMQTANLLTQVFKKVNPKMKKYLSKLGEDDPARMVQTLRAVAKWN